VSLVHSDWGRVTLAKSLPVEAFDYCDAAACVNPRPRRWQPGYVAPPGELAGPPLPSFSQLTAWSLEDSGLIAGQVKSHNRRGWSVWSRSRSASRAWPDSRMWRSPSRGRRARFFNRDGPCKRSCCKRRSCGMFDHPRHGGAPRRRDVRDHRRGGQSRPGRGTISWSCGPAP